VRAGDVSAKFAASRRTVAHAWRWTSCASTRTGTRRSRPRRELRGRAQLSRSLLPGHRGALGRDSHRRPRRVRGRRPEPRSLARIQRNGYAPAALCARTFTCDTVHAPLYETRLKSWVPHGEDAPSMIARAEVLLNGGRAPTSVWRDLDIFVRHTPQVPRLLPVADAPAAVRCSWPTT
jgi:hypothetical protein